MLPHVYDQLYRTRIDETVRYLSHYVTSHPDPCRILDIGCGTGAVLGRLAENHNVTAKGVDCDPDLIAYAKKGVSSRVDFEVGDILDKECRERLIAAGPYDLITMMFHVVNYFPYLTQVQELLQDLRGVLTDRSMFCFDAWGPEVQLFSGYSRELSDGSFIITKRIPDESLVGSILVEFTELLPDNEGKFDLHKEDVLMTPHSRSALELVARQAGYSQIHFRPGLDGWDMLCNLSCWSGAVNDR